MLTTILIAIAVIVVVFVVIVSMQPMRNHSCN